MVSESVFDEVTKLKCQTGKNIVILGSNMLSVRLMEQRLIDEFRLMINPVAIGKGVPLFAGLSRPTKLKLIDSRAFKSGNVLNRYSES